MDSVHLRQVLIALLCLLALAGCGGRQAAEARRQRPPLRELFPPPSIEPAAGEVVPAPPAAAGAAAAVAPPAAAAAAATAAAAEAAAPAPQPEQPGASLKPPPGAIEPANTLKAPSLEEDAAGAQDPGVSESAPGIDMEKEFASVPEAESSVPAASEPAPVERTPAPGAPAAAAEEASAAVAAAAAPSLSPPAPRIIVSNAPAVLVSIQGQPAYGPIEGTKLQRVLNTPAFLVKGGSGNHYLSVYDGFMRATKLTGPWSVLSNTARVVQDAKARALADGEADVLAGRPNGAGQRPTLKAVVPRIIVSTQPAVLVVIRGDPEYEPIEGTRLSRVTNTDARLFVNRPEDRTYLQVSERWYRAPSLKGPWEPVEAAALPEGLEEAALAK